MRLESDPGPPGRFALPRTGTPYHLLARTDRHRWWRPLTRLALLVVLWTVFLLLTSGIAMGLASAAGVRFDDVAVEFSDPLWTMVLAFVSIATALPAVQLSARWAQRRPAGTLSSVEGRLRWRWLLDCLRWALLCFLVVVAFDLVRGIGWDPSRWPGWSTFLVVLALTVVLVPLQAGAEEYLVRGWFIQTLTSWTRTPWPGMVLGSVLFVLGHEYTDPLVFVDLFLFGIALSWLTIRTGGLEAGIALHVVNNLVGVVIEATQGVPNIDQTGDYSIWDVLPSLAVTLAYTWWIDRRACRLESSSQHRNVRG